MTLTDRFWAKVDKTDTCWHWTACVNSRGYGCFGVEGKSQLAHRLAYEAHAGPIPNGLTIDHLCRNKRCVNPDHLEPVTLQENIRRAVALITHCKRGHELPPAAPGSRQRRCSECRTPWNPSTPDQIPEGTEHGLSTYNYYRCRCSVCRAANSAYHRKYYAADRAA